MSFPTERIPPDIWNQICSFIYSRVDNKFKHLKQLEEDRYALTEETKQGAISIINLSMSCSGLYNVLEGERITALDDLRYIQRLNNFLRERFEKSQADFSRNFPGDLVSVFRMRRIENNITSLPVLDLKGRNYDYIDFLIPRDMSHPIMRFESVRRKGIAMHLRVHQEGSKYSNQEGVLVMFQRYTPEEDWVDTGDWIDNRAWVVSSPRVLTTAYRELFHNKSGHQGLSLNCETCTHSRDPIFSEILPRILSGTDPVLELAKPYRVTLWLRFFMSKILPLRGDSQS